MNPKEEGVVDESALIVEIFPPALPPTTVLLPAVLAVLLVPGGILRGVIDTDGRGPADVEAEGIDIAPLLVPGLVELTVVASILAVVVVVVAAVPEAPLFVGPFVAEALLFPLLARIALAGLYTWSLVMLLFLLDVLALVLLFLGFVKSPNRFSPTGVIATDIWALLVLIPN